MDGRRTGQVSRVRSDRNDPAGPRDPSQQVFAVRRPAASGTDMNRNGEKVDPSHPHPLHVMAQIRRNHRGIIDDRPR
jgi:hypothetical protein